MGADDPADQAVTGIRPGSTWGDAVESDEIKSKNGRWYEVISVARLKGGKEVRVRLKGIKNLVTRNASDPVELKRGVTGDAVDVIGVIFSGPSWPTANADNESEA